MNVSTRFLFLMLLLSSLDSSVHAKTAFRTPNCPALEERSESDAAKPLPAVTAERRASDLPKPESSKALEQAKKVNLVPLSIIQTETESKEQRQLIGDAERTQLSDLWSATIQRSPDIQFVIQLLQPSSDNRHRAAVAMRSLSKALLGVTQNAPLLVPAGGGSVAARLGTGLGGGLLGSILSKGESEASKRNETSEALTALMYKMVRQTADELTDNYRQYKKNLDGYDAAASDLAALQAQMETNGGSWTPAEALLIDAELRAGQREIKAWNQELELHRAKLVEMAGSEAVARLDQDIQSERDALAKLIGVPDVIQPLNVPAPESAKTDGIGERNRN